MKINAAFLAERISINDGVVDVSRGWPEWWGVETIPGTTEVLIGLVIDFQEDEMGREFRFTAVFRQQDTEAARGEIEVTPARKGEFVAGVPYHHPFWFKLSNIPVSDVGQCEIELTHEGESMAVIPFVIRLKP